MGDPPVLFLDEPTDGLDPIQKSAIRAILKEMAESKTIVMSTHILEEAELLCQELAIMRHGEIVSAGPIKNFLSKKGRLKLKLKMLIGDFRNEYLRRCLRQSHFGQISQKLLSMIWTTFT